MCPNYKANFCGQGTKMSVFTVSILEKTFVHHNFGHAHTLLSTIVSYHQEQNCEAIELLRLTRSHETVKKEP